MNSHLIQIRNRSTVLADSDVISVLPAVQRHVSFHLKAFWNVGAIIHFQPSGQSPTPGAWLFDLMDDSDEPGALGYHSVGADGAPYAKVFARTDMDTGLSWTVTLTHEIDELLVDVNCNLAAETDHGVFYGFEVGDPVEGDQFAYEIDGVLVSDFVTPAWFAGGPGPYDMAGHCTRPLEVLPNGYASIYRDGQGWGTFQRRGDQLVPVADPDSRRLRGRYQAVWAGGSSRLVPTPPAPSARS